MDICRQKDHKPWFVVLFHGLWSFWRHISISLSNRGEKTTFLFWHVRGSNQGPLELCTRLCQVDQDAIFLAHNLRAHKRMVSTMVCGLTDHKRMVSTMVC